MTNVSQNSSSNTFHSAPVVIRGPFEPHTFTVQSMPITSFVGRQHELRTASSLLMDDGIRLLTLTGPGGVGKTRLAIRLADLLAPSFDDGAVFIPLSTLRNPTLALSAIAFALGMRDASDLPPVARARQLRADRRGGA
jgi:hypothetical protein